MINKDMVIKRVVIAQDPMGGGAPPPMPPMGGDPMGGMGAPPMGGMPGAPPPGADAGAPPAADMPQAGAESEKDAKKTNLEDQVPDDLKESIKQQVKEKVSEKIQEITGKAPAEVPEEGATPEGGEMPTMEGGTPPTEAAAPTEITGENIEEFPSVIDQLSNDQLEELFNKASDMIMGKDSEKGGEEKAEKKTSEEKLDEFSDLEPPDDLTMVAAIKKGIVKKASDIVVGHMETDGQYYVSCPNASIKSMIGIPRIHPIAQCQNCPHYGDNGDNSGGSMAQIFCGYSIDASAGSIPVRYVAFNTEKPVDTTLPFGNLIKQPEEEKGKKKAAQKIPVKKVKKVAGLNLEDKAKELMVDYMHQDQPDRWKPMEIGKESAFELWAYIKKEFPEFLDTDKGREVRTILDDIKKEKKEAGSINTIKKVAKKDSEYFAETNKQDDVFLKKNEYGEMVIEGTTYKLKRVGTDVEIYEGSKLIDTIKGGINYNDQIVRDTEFMARMNKNVQTQSTLDNRRAFYDDLFRFRKYASEGRMSSRQAFRTIVRESSYDSENKANEFKAILEDNGYDIVLTHEDKNWIRRAVRANSNNITRLATRRDVKARSQFGWDDSFFEDKNLLNMDEYD